MAQPFPCEPDTAPSPLSCTTTLAECDVVTPVQSRAVDDDGDKAGPTPRDGGAAGATGGQGAAMGEQGVRGGIALADARAQARAPVEQGNGPSEQEGRPSGASSTVYPLVDADFQAYNAETWRRMPADLRTHLSAWVAPVSPSGRAPESYGNSRASSDMISRPPSGVFALDEDDTSPAPSSQLASFPHVERGRTRAWSSAAQRRSPTSPARGRGCSSARAPSQQFVPLLSRRASGRALASLADTRGPADPAGQEDWAEYPPPAPYLP